MKNKKSIQARLKLVNQLLGAVNSEEEFNYLKSLKFIQMKGGVRNYGK